ncbi:M48 family metallopeptidase [Pseudoduganella sp. S-14]|uniref:M48 family metallopeptidase n=1 Tax=Pseudoduganella sp. S-14 TaxID=3404065 RepID=UPI003CF99658
MEYKAFEHLVRRLELDSNSSPEAFRRKVFAIGLGAYATLFGLLAGLLALFAMLVQWAIESHRAFAMIKAGLAGLFLLSLIFVILRVMLMRLDPPTGRELVRDEAPKLFDILEKLYGKLHGPRIQHVLITDEYNAAIVQHARFGIFGGYRNYLLVGLPFLLGSTPKEMLAVLAHEYGHLCGDHAKGSTTIYRQRRLFVAMYQHLESSADDNVVSAAIVRALQRFFPYYSAYTFVLSRQDEYEADQVAVDMAGHTATSQMLVRARLLGDWIAHDFWPSMYENADRLERPPFMPFSSMRLAIKANYDEWATKKALDTAWATRSDLDDTHPCLRERLDAIEMAPVLPPPVDTCAADVMLAAGVGKKLEAELDQDWWEVNSRGWVHRFRHVQNSRVRIGELSASPLAKLSVQDLLELASLKLDFEDTASAKPALVELMKRGGGPYPRASLMYGRVLVAEGDRRGVDHLREAALNEPRLLEEAAQRGYQFLLERDGEAVANRWWGSIVPQDEPA